MIICVDIYIYICVCVSFYMRNCNPYCWVGRTAWRVKYLYKRGCLRRQYVPGQKGSCIQHLSRRWYAETPSFLNKMSNQVSLARVRGLSSGGVFRAGTQSLPEVLRTHRHGVQLTSPTSWLHHYWCATGDCNQFQEI